MSYSPRSNPTMSSATSPRHATTSQWDRLGDPMERFRADQRRGKAALMTSRRVKRDFAEDRSMQSLGIFSEPSYIGVGTSKDDPSLYGKFDKLYSTGRIFSVDGEGRLKGLRPVPLADADTDYKPSWCPPRAPVSVGSAGLGASVSGDKYFSRHKLMPDPTPPGPEAVQLEKREEARIERSKRLSAREPGVPAWKAAPIGSSGAAVRTPRSHLTQG